MILIGRDSRCYFIKEIKPEVFLALSEKITEKGYVVVERIIYLDDYPEVLQQIQLCNKSIRKELTCRVLYNLLEFGKLNDEHSGNRLFIGNHWECDNYILGYAEQMNDDWKPRMV